MTEYNFLIAGEKGRAFLIKPIGATEKWSLWFWNRGHHYLLFSTGGLEAKEFDGPKACVAYCNAVTDADAVWAAFCRRAGIGSTTPEGMGVERRWLPAAQMPTQPGG